MKEFLNNHIWKCYFWDFCKKWYLIGSKNIISVFLPDFHEYEEIFEQSSLEIPFLDSYEKWYSVGSKIIISLLLHDIHKYEGI
jgi:hypothetical protein